MLIQQLNYVQWLISPLDYILSHKIMNSVITYNYNFENEELVAYYMSMLKSFAVRIDDSTIPFFYNEVTSL